MSAAVDIDDLWWRYPTYGATLRPWTLRGVNLHVEQGECVGITGPSGAGKTTLCRVLLGILPANARLTSEQLPHHFRGTVTILGEPTNAKTARGEQRVGMVMQDPENQFLRMSLLHELGLGLQLQGLPPGVILERAQEALRAVGLEYLWKGAAYVHPSELSGGQKQRVAIAAFLALRPQLLILDEPTSDLDPLGKREIIATIARLRRELQMTVLLVEQDPDILTAFCDRMVLLHEGHVRLIAPPASFYMQQQSIARYGAPVGELTRISWQTGYSYQGSSQARPPLTLQEAVSAFTPALKKATERQDTQTAPVEATNITHPSSPPVVSAEQVAYRYDDGTSALRGVSLELARGEMVALLGPNGSGKTTFARILAGLYRPERGRVRVLGRDVSLRRERASLATAIGYVFQNPDAQLFCRSVRSEIDYGLKNLGLDPARRRATIAATLEAVNLAEFADEDPLFLSKGQRQQLAVAAVLAMGPEVLIVDEPTTGQDTHSIAAMMRLLTNLQQQGKTILLITHDMTLAAHYCQRVVAFRDGAVSFSGTPAQLFEDAAALAATGLYPPLAAALATQLRATFPQLPPLLTVPQWCQYLDHNDAISEEW
jgi:energy-coupling factor transporter ATP-binding protein EcfA2